MRVPLAAPLLVTLLVLFAAAPWPIAGAAEGEGASPDVAGEPSSVRIEAPRLAVNVGRSMQLRAVVLDASGAPVEGAEVTWSTDHGAVSASGLFSAEETGSATISVRTTNGVEDTIAIDVVTTLHVDVDVSARTGSGAGTVTVRYLDGAPVPFAVVELAFGRAGSVSTTSSLRADVTASTNAAGVMAFRVPPAWTVPGENQVQAQAELGPNSGEELHTYTVSIF